MTPPTNSAPPPAVRNAAWHAGVGALGVREQPSPGWRVLVIGGGIGGLSAALCLASVGAEVLVFEAATEIAELGVGLNVQPAAVGVLTELGLLPALDAVGVRTAELLMMTRGGQLVLRQRRAGRRRGASAAVGPSRTPPTGAAGSDTPTWLRARSTSATGSAPSRRPADAPRRCSTSMASRRRSMVT